MIKEWYFEGYKAELDNVNEHQWCDYLSQFEDATIYQTWSYAKVRWGEKSLSHLIIKKDSAVASVAQVVVREIPYVKIGVAYIPWGPLWRARSRGIDIDSLRTMLRAIKYFYGRKRKLLIRMTPHEVEGEIGWLPDLYREEGFIKASFPPYRTLLLDLQPSLGEIRKQFKSKWRNGLNRAEKKGLSVIEGTSDADFCTFLSLQKDMMAIKKYKPGVDYDEFREIQNALKINFKMRIYTCLLEGKPVASLVGSILGNKGIYLLGASNNIGRRACASYLLQWKMIESLKRRGIRYYDLGGIDPNGNPGVFHFKSGLRGKDISHVGYYEACENPLSTLLVVFSKHVKSAARIYRKNINGFI